MQIELPDDIQQIANKAVADGEYTSVAEFIAAAVRAIANTSLGDRDENAIIDDEWERRFRDWAASHSAIEHVVDDSRESIYEGRGL